MRLHLPPPIIALDRCGPLADVQVQATPRWWLARKQSHRWAIVTWTSREWWALHWFRWIEDPFWEFLTYRLHVWWVIEEGGFWRQGEFCWPWTWRRRAAQRLAAYRLNGTAVR